ncbi:hypothetical protein FNI15_21345 [Salmonella enterica subsp. salamae]|nr:hypothetical protein [Salmonella enterica subsp. salamae]EDN4180673.1 hypothetical protein [Salmonella enterica subsp. salamae]
MTKNSGGTSSRCYKLQLRNLLSIYSLWDCFDLGADSEMKKIDPATIHYQNIRYTNYQQII